MSIPELFEKDPLDLLDSVLHSFPLKSLLGITPRDVCNRINCPSEDSDYIISAIRLLIDDGYIYYKTGSVKEIIWAESKLALSYKGRMFLLNGGYTQQKFDLLRKKHEDNLRVSEEVKRHQSMLAATWFAGLAAAMLGIVEVVNLILNCL